MRCPKKHVKDVFSGDNSNIKKWGISKNKHVIIFQTEKEPKITFFDFGAFQKIMKMLSREKTSFTCFLGHLIIVPSPYYHESPTNSSELELRKNDPFRRFVTAVS